VRATAVHRLLLTLIPAMLIASVALSTIWGNNGLIARHQLEQQLQADTRDLASIDRENQRLLTEIGRMDRDPQVLERVVAEELSYGRKGAVIYRFDDGSDTSGE
jgi:cell division protein FtsB